MNHRILVTDGCDFKWKRVSITVGFAERILVTRFENILEIYIYIYTHIHVYLNEIMETEGLRTN